MTDTFKLDTSGIVRVNTPFVGRDPDSLTRDRPVMVGGPVQWGHLSPFTQGYIEALARSNFEAVAAMPSDNDETGICKWCGRNNNGEPDPCSDDCPRQRIAFADLAPETLARIIADCEAFAPGPHPDLAPAKYGREFYTARHNGFSGWSVDCADYACRFPPLTVTLGDDGKARFA